MLSNLNTYMVHTLFIASHYVIPKDDLEVSAILNKYSPKTNDSALRWCHCQWGFVTFLEVSLSPIGSD